MWNPGGLWHVDESHLLEFWQDFHCMARRLRHIRRVPQVNAATGDLAATAFDCQCIAHIREVAVLRLSQQIKRLVHLQIHNQNQSLEPWFDSTEAVAANAEQAVKCTGVERCLKDCECVWESHTCRRPLP